MTWVIPPANDARKAMLGPIVILMRRATGTPRCS